VKGNAPANDGKLLRADAAARELGFPTTAALRKWCKREGFAIYALGRLAFVDIEAIRAALRASVRTAARPRPAPIRDDVDTSVNDAIARRR
jgi:hypothetical protein